ncbi:DMT family transporter [Tindallia californiensis]|uniref:Permease of the drug/metabolite transporter (DMT) superfamily n=1 Tax=Tindallia californiensis TaxID=159292 RepID=A0A1H3MH19_9FIRM|nr:DMT family transporter [Tindallia californiensis]SDY75345.1 Permease of the drug/metabolite transporter (DMT) superfamily [Tindallia californiensis]
MNSLTAKQKKYAADLSLLFVAFAWGGGFVAVKDALNSLTPMYLMAFRFTLAAVVVYVSLHRWIGKISIQEFRNSSVVGTILFLAFAAQTVGLQYTTASKQGFLTATYVIMVPFLYWLLYKKRPPLKVFIGSFLTLIGIGFIGLDSTLSLNKGDWLTLLCALFFAMHILSIEYYTKTIHVFKVAFIQISVAALWFIGAALIFEPMPASLPSRAWIAIVYMAVVSTFGCFTVQTVAQKHTTSSHASIIMSLESVFAAVLGVWLLQEEMTIAMLFGCALIFVAILMVEVNLKKSLPEPEVLGIEADR